MSWCAEAHQLISERTRRQPISPSATLTPLYDALKVEPVTVKLLYLWLGPTGETSLSQREIARALGISQGAVSLSLVRLRALGLADGKKMGTSAEGEHTGPSPLPEVLLAENPTTKLVYLYLSPHDEVEVSVRQLVGRLGISHRPSTEALQRLVVSGVLQRCDTPANRPGMYMVDAEPCPES